MTWGSWTFIDSKKDTRPQTDYYQAYPNRDVPRKAFPPNSWQTDSEYLSQFLQQSIDLVERTQEAILAEYGKSATAGVNFKINHLKNGHQKCFI